MRLRLLTLLALVLATAAPAAAQTTGQTPFRPVAVVNDTAITGFDLEQRVRILSVLGYPTDDPAALRAAALDQLVEDKLKLQAGEQIGITPTPEMIATGMADFASRAGMQPDEFRAMLEARGVTHQALEDWLGAQLVWLNVLRTRFGSQLEPGEAEIDAQMAQATPDGEPPSRESVRSQLINERGERFAEGLLQEMRRDALIEVR